jgi:hypothetical protein
MARRASAMAPSRTCTLRAFKKTPSHNSSSTKPNVPEGGCLAMPTEHTSTSSSGLDTTKLLSELEVPFSPDQVRCGLLLGARGCESGTTNRREPSTTGISFRSTGSSFWIRRAAGTEMRNRRVAPTTRQRSPTKRCRSKTGLGQLSLGGKMSACRSTTAGEV